MLTRTRTQEQTFHLEQDNRMVHVTLIYLFMLLIDISVDRAMNVAYTATLNSHTLRNIQCSTFNVQRSCHQLMRVLLPVHWRVQFKRFWSKPCLFCVVLLYCAGKCEPGNKFNEGGRLWFSLNFMNVLL